MEKYKLAKIESHILDYFSRRGTSKLLAKEIFESTATYANADLVRAFEDMEKKWRMLVRHTEDGNDWVHLTPEGARHAGLAGDSMLHEAHPHPPNSMPR